MAVGLGKGLWIYLSRDKWPHDLCGLRLRPLKPCLDGNLPGEEAKVMVASNRLEQPCHQGLAQIQHI